MTDPTTTQPNIAETLAREMAKPIVAATTDEQVQADRQACDAHIQKTFVAIAVAARWRVKPKPDADRHEVVECPICKGRLHMTQSSYNGHVHGKCESDGCVSWME